MRKMNLLFRLFLVFVFCLAAQKMSAQNVDMTSFIVNNDFEKAVDENCQEVTIGDGTGILGFASGAWRPTNLTATSCLNYQFYGFTWSIGPFKSGSTNTMGNNSQGLNKDADAGTMHGDFCCWIGGNYLLPELVEFYQTINGLSAGTYKVQCRLGVNDNKRTTQRLFANNNVQYHGTAAQHALNTTAGETNTFAGWPSGEKNLQEMFVYVTIADNEPLKIGIRTGNKKMDGTTAVKADPYWGWFKVDYFRLTKMEGDAYLTDAKLSGITLSSGTVDNFSPTTTSYNVVVPAGTTLVTPKIVFNSNGATATGTETVDVSSGSGVSTIVVTALDGIATETYTINYSRAANDYTGSIVNSNFDYVATSIPFSKTGLNYPNFPGTATSTYSIDNNGTCRGIKTGLKEENFLHFYGWEMSNLSYLFNGVDGATKSQSIGVSAGVSSTDGSSAWINGDPSCNLPDNFEFSQTVNGLPTGTYQLTCLMGVQVERNTSQRLFASTPTKNNVQFYGQESVYVQNKTAGEKYSYAGYSTTGSSSGDDHKVMKVYIPVTAGEPLKVGIRSGITRGDGANTVATSGNMYGWVKMDKFALIKLNAAEAADATLSGITLSVGTVDNFAPATGTYSVTLPAGTTSVTPTPVVNFNGATLTGAGVVNINAGTGTSTIVVTAADEVTTKTYTINYTVSNTTGLNNFNVKTATWSVENGNLTVQGADACQVYNINGVKVADVKAANPISLIPGIYIVKTSNAETFKVVVK